MLNREKLIRFCQDLIQLKSLSGQEGKVAERIVREMKDLGYDQIRTDPYGNVIGKINGKGERSLLFEGHMDIVDVPTPEDWSVDPFGGVIQDDRIYGRGAADMKTALAAMIHGAAEIAGQSLEADIYVAAIVYEEIFEGVGFGKVLDEIKPDAIVLGEPNDLQIAIAQKGRAEIVLETFGVNSHSAHPEAGVNALNHMVLLLEEINSIPVIESEVLGKGILVPTDIVSSPYPGASIIPDRCRVTIDRRLVEDETRESVLKPIREKIELLKGRLKNFNAQVSFAVEELPTYTGDKLKSERFYPGWVLSDQHDLVNKALQAYSDEGETAVLGRYVFCTDGSECAGKRNIPTIGIGPARAEMAHVVDECVELEKVISAAKIYSRLAGIY